MLKVKNVEKVTNWEGWYKIDPIDFDKTVKFLHATYFLSDFMIIGENVYTKNLAYIKF
jgi:hypothetical protein